MNCKTPTIKYNLLIYLLRARAHHLHIKESYTKHRGSFFIALTQCHKQFNIQKPDKTIKYIRSLRSTLEEKK